METLTLIPGEFPSLQLGLFDLEKVGSSDRLGALLRNGEVEVWVRFSDTGLGAVDGGVNFKTNVKVLTGEEVGPIDEMSVRFEICERGEASTGQAEGCIQE